MILILSAGGPPSLIEWHDFGSFKAVIPEGSSRGELARLSTAAGVFDETHFWVDCDWLTAQGPDDPAWQKQLMQMLAYAQSKGWMQSERVRVHLEEENATG